MKDYIDIQERPSWGRMLPLSFQHLFAMFGSTVLVPYLLKEKGTLRSVSQSAFAFMSRSLLLEPNVVNLYFYFS